MENYFNYWQFKPKPLKTVSSVFHLHNSQAKRMWCTKVIAHDPNPCYLGVTLDCIFTYQHLKQVSHKTYSHLNIIQKLVGSSWGCDAQMKQTATLVLVYSTAEYCAPV